MKRILCVVLFSLMALPALAHKASDSFLYWSVPDGEGRLDLALRDLRRIVPLDTNDDGAIQWREVQGRQAAISAQLEQALSVRAGGRDCATAVSLLGLTRHSDGPYLASRVRPDCGGAGQPESLHYDLLFSSDRLHRSLVTLDNGGELTHAVLAPENPELALAPVFMGQTAARFFRQGVIHLLVGFDHLLFLVALVLPSVVYRYRGEWWVRGSAGASVREVAGIVTAFTIAHSLTLAVAALDIVTLPARVVESLIALSIVVAAVNILKPFPGRSRYLMGFVFGLIHGFGFAGVLAEVMGPGVSRVVALAAFNLGVEAAQLALVVLTVPVLFWMRHARLYQRLALPAGASMIAAMGLFWFGQRAFV